jgi:hypothetical protein
MEDNKKSDTAKRIKVKLYRFQPPSCERLERLSNDSLWFSDPKTFNDPMDMQLDIKDLIADRWSDAETFRSAFKKAFRLLLEEKAEFSRAFLFDKQLTESLTEWADNSVGIEDPGAVIVALQARIDKVGVACFMRTFDSRLMWAHYAESGKGFCIEYEIVPFEHPEAIQYIPVQYVSGLPPLCITEALFSPHQFFHRVIGTKHIDWAYEREVRLVAIDSKGEAIQVEQKFIQISRLIGGYAMSSCLEMCLKKTADRLGDIPVVKAEFTATGEIVVREPLQ